MKKTYLTILLCTLLFCILMIFGCSNEEGNPTSPALVLTPTPVEVLHQVEYRVQSPNAEYLQISWTESDGAGNSSVSAAVLGVGSGWTTTVQLPMMPMVMVAKYPDALGGHFDGTLPAEINAQILVDGEQIAQGSTVCTDQGDGAYVGQLEVNYNIR